MRLMRSIPLENMEKRFRACFTACIVMFVSSDKRNVIYRCKLREIDERVELLLTENSRAGGIISFRL